MPFGGHNADYIEVRLEEAVSNHISYAGRDLEDIGASSSRGGNARALVGGGWGFVCFNDLSNLSEKVALAVSQARMVGGERVSLAPVDPRVDIVPPHVKKDPAQVPLTVKKTLLDEYNSIMWSVPAIQSSSISYADRNRTVYFANSEGSYIEQGKVDVVIRLSAMARDGADVQQAGVSRGSNGDFSFVEELHQDARDVADKAVRLLKAPQIKGGEHTVILDPVLAGVFIHEAFGHLSEADQVYDNDQMKDIMVLGSSFGGPHLNVVDGGAVDGLRGSYKYDDEGVPSTRTDLIREGVLVGRLHSRETAAKMGEPPSGNARAISHQFPPIVRIQHLHRAGRGVPCRPAGRRQGWCVRLQLVRRHDQHGDVHLLIGRGIHDTQRKDRGAGPAGDALRKPVHNPSKPGRGGQRPGLQSGRGLRERRSVAFAGEQRKPAHSHSELPGGRGIGRGICAGQGSQVGSGV